jgi:hypothetical protein
LAGAEDGTIDGAMEGDIVRAVVLMSFLPTPKTNPRTKPRTNRASNKKQGYARLVTLGTGFHGEVHLILRLDNQILEEKRRPAATTRWNDPLFLFKNLVI